MHSLLVFYYTGSIWWWNKLVNVVTTTEWMILTWWMPGAGEADCEAWLFTRSTQCCSYFHGLGHWYPVNHVCSCLSRSSAFLIFNLENSCEGFMWGSTIKSDKNQESFKEVANTWWLKFFYHHLVQKLMYTLLFIVIITELDDPLLSEHMFWISWHCNMKQ